MSLAMMCLLGAQAIFSQPHDSISDSTRLRTELTRALKELAATEYIVAQKVNAATGNARGNPREKSNTRQETSLPAQTLTDAERTRHANAVSRARALLDTVVFQRPWGASILARLRSEYPGSLLLERYDAGLLARDGKDSLALIRYTALLRKTPEDSELQLAHAVLLQNMGCSQDAQLGFERVLELNPNDTTAYQALMQQHNQTGTLASLLLQIQRLRARHQNSTVLLDREIELLHRLGRLKEAKELAEKKQ